MNQDKDANVKNQVDEINIANEENVLDEINITSYESVVDEINITDEANKNHMESRLMHVKQILRFGTVGLLNTGIDFGIFTALTMMTGLPPQINHVISYSCGVINSYFFNRLWTFRVRKKANSIEFIKFILLNIISLGVSTLVLSLLYDKAGLNTLISKLGATFCSLVVNFVGSKLIVFNDSKVSSKDRHISSEDRHMCKDEK